MSAAGIMTAEGITTVEGTMTVAARRTMTAEGITTVAAKWTMTAEGIMTAAVAETATGTETMTAADPYHHRQCLVLFRDSRVREHAAVKNSFWGNGLKEYSETEGTGWKKSACSFDVR